MCLFVLALAACRANKIAIGRIIGNNMSPLQGPSQSRLNLMHTLEHETLPSQRCFEYHTRIKCYDIVRFWVVNRILNTTEFDLIQTELDNHDESYSIIPINDHVMSRSHNMSQYVTNINGARNHVIDECSALGATWAVVLDGSSFITDEILEGMLVNIETANDKDLSYAGLVTYRLLYPDAIDALGWESRIEEMTSIISRQEAQLAIRVGAPFLFAESGDHAHYGKRDKFSLTLKARESKLMHCRDTGFDDHKTALDIGDVQSCGGVFRLPYYSMLRNELDLIRSSDARKLPRRDSVNVLNCILLDRLRPYMQHYHWTVRWKVMPRRLMFRYLVRGIKMYRS
eukprot:GHVU01137166.1.p1 GENE.GHVU01137166.1~~GHVU01137166.1.p1  ORF type:complete len:342 (+),score=-2.92 GHVU01137166.1:80-1105(+)